MKHRPIIKACMEKGWEPSRITGGHLIMTKENKRSVPIPIHGKGLDLSIILKQLEQLPPKPEEKREFNIAPKVRLLKPQKHKDKSHLRKKVLCFCVSSNINLGDEIWR